MALEWSRVQGTKNWQLVDTEAGRIVRHIAVRDPYINEPDGTKFVVTGEGHPAPSDHESLEEAQTEAEASLATGGPAWCATLEMDAALNPEED